jgi:hypothetical protein
MYFRYESFEPAVDSDYISLGIPFSNASFALSANSYFGTLFPDFFHQHIFS